MKNSIEKILFFKYPRRMLYEFISSLIVYLNWIFSSIVFIRYILIQINEKDSFLQIMLFLGISALGFGIGKLFQNWYNEIYKPISNSNISNFFNAKIYEKAASIDLKCYEDASYYNKYSLAIREVDLRLTSIIETIPAVIWGSVATIIVATYMFSVDPFVIIFVLFPVLGNFVFGKKYYHIIYCRDKESAKAKRRKEYATRIVYLVDYAKELRNSKVKNVIREIYQKGKEEIKNITKKFALYAMFAKFLKNIFTFLIIFMGVTAFGVYKTLVTHTMQLNDFVVLNSAMVSASWILIGLSDNLVKMVENRIYIQNLNEFLNYKPKKSLYNDNLTPERKLKELKIQDVTFIYHGKERKGVKSLSFEIFSGEKIAIVGMNGAGKTTLIKLLTRLYDVDSGNIFYNGVDVRKYDIERYRALFAVAFQECKIFSMSIIENILMRKPNGLSDYEKVEKILKQVGLLERIKKLPYGLDTILTKEFCTEGVVLSGGELQKLSIARAMAKMAPIIILDEPTSALDAIAENDIFNLLVNTYKEETLIFISHRLSSAMLADRILVFKDGEIVEQGTHEELMKNNQFYAKMFEKQSKNYLL